MEFDSTISWISQPNVCRCCLAANGTWDLTSSYTTDAGNHEVLSDILKECFGITLSRLTDWRCSRLVCGLCVRDLQTACDFRSKVLKAESQFNEHLRDVTNLSVECENDEIQTNALDDSPDFSHDDDKEQSEIQICLPQTTKGEQKKNKTKKKKTKTPNENNCDSDKPIGKLLFKNVLLDQLNEDETLNKREHPEAFAEKKLDSVQFCIEEQHSKQDVKQVSERKRVILTCEIVLKDTTACPFRHHKSWFQCFFCSEDYMEINLLRNHIQQLHTNLDEELKNIKRYPRSLQIDITELKCRHCDLPLTDVEAMTRHFQFSHQKIIYKECIADYKVDASPYTCHICMREFHVFRTLTTHLNEHYANCICDVCGKSFLNSKRLKVHKRTHENGTYPCKECGKVLKTKTSKANHMESAHSKRIVKCQICFKPMKHYNDRIKHMSEVHNITHKFKCSICSREYNIKHYLATHMRQTHGHKNKKCLECGMAFITNHGLKKHMLRHSGEKPFSCSVCSKSYVRSSTLREHMRMHEAEKEH